MIGESPAVLSFETIEAATESDFALRSEGVATTMVVNSLTCENSSNATASSTVFQTPSVPVSIVTWRLCYFWGNSGIKRPTPADEKSR